MALRPYRYKHIFFDLDHTLWDFEKNSTETLSELYHKHDLLRLGSFSEDSFRTQFQEVNSQLWKKSDEGAMDRDTLRRVRFQLVCRQLGLEDEGLAAKMGEDYLSLCPTKTALLPYAMEILQYLSSKYRLHILTNGFSDVQAVKLNSSGIFHFFDEVFTAENLGVGKPDKSYFTKVMQQINARPPDCLMIGDNLKTDILGAQNAGIDQIYYNPGRRRYFMEVQHEIHCLSELKNIF